MWKMQAGGCVWKMHATVSKDINIAISGLDDISRRYIFAWLVFRNYSSETSKADPEVINK